MNVEKYKAQNGLTNSDVIDIIKPEFPKFGKSQLSMVSKGTYGVTLAAKAVKLLNAAHPSQKKENRIRGNKITFRLNDYLYALLIEYRDERGYTMQEAVEMLIYTSLKEKARTTQPHELNSKLKTNERKVMQNEQEQAPESQVSD